MNKGNRVVISQLPATVDHFLAATFHFRVIPLYGGEIQVFFGFAGRHRRCRTTAQADVHGWAAKHNQFCAHRNVAFLHVFGTNVADTARQHDRFVVATHFFAIEAIHFLFVSTEIAEQCRTTEFVVKRRAT